MSAGALDQEDPMCRWPGLQYRTKTGPVHASINSTLLSCPTFWPFTFLSPGQQCLNLNLKKILRSYYCSPARPSDLVLSPAAGSWWHHKSIVTSRNKDFFMNIHFIFFLNWNPPKILQVQIPCRNLYRIVCYLNKFTEQLVNTGSQECRRFTALKITL